jgi:hypothetical protein
MTCTHQWHDATTSAGAEWVCSRCKITYTQTKKAPATPKREWVGLTDVNAVELWQLARHDIVEFSRAIEAKLKELNT